MDEPVDADEAAELVEAIDEELAMSADAEVEGEFEEVAPPPPPEVSEVEITEEQEGQSEDGATPAATQDADAPPAPDMEDLASIASGSAAAQTQKSDAAGKLAQADAATDARVDEPSGTSVMAQAGSILVQVLTLANRPFEHMPASIRDTIGLVAAVTLFYAISIWLYLLFVR